jgi:hypothetical protein
VGAIFGDDVMAAALVDRLVHHCHIVTVRGNSDRLPSAWGPRSAAPELASGASLPVAELDPTQSVKSKRQEERHPSLELGARPVAFSPAVDTHRGNKHTPHATDRVECGQFDTASFASAFDGLTMVHFIEHLGDPGSAIREAASLVIHRFVLALVTLDA